MADSAVPGVTHESAPDTPQGHPPNSTTADALTGRPDVAGWSLLLAPDWSHIPLAGARRKHGIKAFLDRSLATYSRDAVAALRRDLARHVDALADQAAGNGGVDLYLASAIAHGLPVSASCVASVLNDSIPAGVPADLTATVLASGPGDHPTTVTVDGVECAAVRRTSPGTGRDPLDEDGNQRPSPDGAELDAAAAIEESARVLPSAGLDVYIPFPDNTPRTLLLSFSTSVPEPVQDAMTSLFEAMAESIRWKRTRS